MHVWRKGFALLSPTSVCAQVQVSLVSAASEGRLGKESTVSSLHNLKVKATHLPQLTVPTAEDRTDSDSKHNANSLHSGGILKN